LEEQITILEEAKSHGEMPARPAPAGLLVALDARRSKPAASIPNYGKPREERARRARRVSRGRASIPNYGKPREEWKDARLLQGKSRNSRLEAIGREIATSGFSLAVGAIDANDPLDAGTSPARKSSHRDAGAP